VDLDAGTIDPWPALYIAEDPETALREKFGMATSHQAGGLTHEELALTRSTSYAAVSVNGMLRQVFDMTTASNLQAIARVLGRIRMPSKAREIQKWLKIRNGELWMISTGQQLYDAALTHVGAGLNLSSFSRSERACSC